jgi:hypothetical protein
MSEQKSEMDEFKENLAKAYSPELSKKDKKKILKYFLDYRCKTVNYQGGTSKKVLDAIDYLQDDKIKWYQKPIGLVGIALMPGILILIFEYFILPFIKH